MLGTAPNNRRMLFTIPYAMPMKGRQKIGSMHFLRFTSWGLVHKRSIVSQYILIDFCLFKSFHQFILPKLVIPNKRILSRVDSFIVHSILRHLWCLYEKFVSTVIFAVCSILCQLKTNWKRIRIVVFVLSA